VREGVTICPPCKLTFDHLTLKVVPKSRVTWATSVPILLSGPSVLDLGPMYTTDRQTDVRQTLNAPYPRGRHKIISAVITVLLYCHKEPQEKASGGTAKSLIMGTETHGPSRNSYGSGREARTEQKPAEIE